MTDLTERAMLASLSISQWTARKYDKQITDKVNAEHGAAHDAGRYNKALISRDALSSITEIVSQSRSTFYRLTLPWGDNGQRIMPATTFMQATEKLRDLRGRFEAAVSEFVGAYPDYVLAAQRSLNGMFDPKDYPTQSQIRRRFGYEVEFQPLPSKHDFRVSLGAEHEEAVKAAIESGVEQRLQRATRDLWERMHAVVKDMIDRLGQEGPDASGKLRGKFKNSVVTNIRELVELLPALNLTGDADLEFMRRELLSELCQWDPEDLRQSRESRRQARIAASEILGSMRGYMGS